MVLKRLIICIWSTSKSASELLQNKPLKCLRFTSENCCRMCLWNASDLHLKIAQNSLWNASYFHLKMHRNMPLNLNQKCLWNCIRICSKMFQNCLWSGIQICLWLLQNLLWMHLKRPLNLPQIHLWNTPESALKCFKIVSENASDLALNALQNLPLNYFRICSNSPLKLISKSLRKGPESIQRRFWPEEIWVRDFWTVKTLFRELCSEEISEQIRLCSESYVQRISHSEDSDQIRSWSDGLSSEKPGSEDTLIRWF